MPLESMYVVVCAISNFGRGVNLESIAGKEEINEESDYQDKKY